MKKITAITMLGLCCIPMTAQEPQPADTLPPAAMVAPLVREPAAIRFLAAWGNRQRAMMSRSTGMLPVGDKVGFGPLASVAGYNTLEGFRLGAGFATLAGLSPHVAFRGSGAYGFRDHRWKYRAEAEWAITPAKGYFGSYPVNSLKASIGYDTYFLGDNALSPLPPRPRVGVSTRRNEMILYRHEGSLSYTVEPSRLVSLTAAATRERLCPTRYISFGPLRDIDAWRASVSATWTPGGDFYQAARRRIDTRPFAPRLTARLQWTEGAGRADNTSLLVAEAAAVKVTPLAGRFTLTALIHATFTTGHGIWPLLPALPSSPYVVRRPGAFALLRPLEITAQRYADFHVRFDDGGETLASLLPVMKPLGISVTASADIAAGEPAGLTDSYPCVCRPLSWRRPYAEAGIGLDKIFGIGRIEYVWRLTYRDIPGCRRSGLTIGIDYVF